MKYRTIYAAIAFFCLAIAIFEAYKYKSLQKSCAHDVLPAEDLMCEHGILRRLLLIYQECQVRLAENHSFEKETIYQAATLIQQFVEDYHERQEENHLFPRFEKAGVLVNLAQTLRAQHNAGRVLTQKILALTTHNINLTQDDQKLLIQSIDQFIRMYRPHATREDTELFPALRTIMTAQEYVKLGDMFEDKEHEMFGPNGFEKILARVIELEKHVGINDLQQYTS